MHKILLSLLAGALLAACTTNPPAPQASPPPEEPVAPAFDWRTVRADITAELRQNAHLSVQEFDNGDLYIQVRSGESFAVASTELSQTLQETLEHVASSVLGHDRLHLRVVGHTDNAGRAERNLQLSEERARVVLSFLAEQGIPDDRLSSEGKGQAEPLASNATREGRAVNRRVEILISLNPRHPIQPR